MIVLDGSMGEGGGQILRTALALSAVTGNPFRLTRIRARRRKPGLARQHLTAVEAAAQVARAEVRGAELGSLELTFRPSRIEGGRYRFSVGTAGSTTLILQTLLPALWSAREPSAVRIEGGTHNPLAPPYEFIERTYLPAAARMGARARVRLVRPGFYPRGGGAIEAEIEPVESWLPLRLEERGKLRRIEARAILAGLPRHIAERELRTARSILDGAPLEEGVEELDASFGPGNVLLLTAKCDEVTETAAGFGERGVRAEEVARRAARALKRWLDAGVPVGEHLADQILIPLALAGEGSFVTLPLSSHAETNIQVIEAFLPVEFAAEDCGTGRVRVSVKRAGDSD